VSRDGKTFVVKKKIEINRDLSINNIRIMPFVIVAFAFDIAAKKVHSKVFDVKSRRRACDKCFKRKSCLRIKFIKMKGEERKLERSMEDNLFTNS